MGVCLAVAASSIAWTPKPVEDDPLARMPGTQPGQVQDLESDKQCLSCHGGFEMDHWKGSMMAQAGRDPLFWAGLTVAAQDAIWALGTPNAADICVKCHFPQGWLDGRSDPVNAALMRGEDFEGVTCKICHYMYDPFFKATYDGTREGSDWTNYWDETNTSDAPSQDAADAAYAADAAAAATIELFNDNDFFSNNAPLSAAYTENGGGQFFVATDNLATGDRDVKRGPFADANAKHKMLYSRHHKSKFICGACHDISNPALANLAYTNTVPDDGITILPSESLPAYSYFHVERTFSEFMLSGFGAQGGVAGTGPYSPDRFKTSHAGNKIATCQDCHFRDLSGQKAGNSGVIRPGDSTEHPLSGVPEHRMIGGNIWVPWILASIDLNSPNYDATNAALLTQGPEVLTLDFTQGEALDPFMLLETCELAHEMLQSSISMTNAVYDLDSNVFSLRLQNHTAHKLISGYPEGRRMFLNVKAYAGDQLIYEVNPYDDSAGTLKGLSHSQSSPALGVGEAYQDELVYEVHQSSSILKVNETFHMAMATARYKDNRILPRGFRVEDAAARLCEPVWHGVSDTNFHTASNYFTAAEYAGGHDDISIKLPAGTEKVQAGLYYQTTSREFIEFLRDEINGTGGTLTGIGAGGDPPYIAQTDEFFSGLAAWGDTIWQLWVHNKDVPGAAPVLMTNTYVQLDVSDEDGDGMPGYWESQHFGGPTNAVAGIDTDGDGRNDEEEYVSLTDPKDGSSVFLIERADAGGLSSTVVNVAFTSFFARAYSLRRTDVLPGSNVWREVSPETRGIDDLLILTHTNEPSARQGMYRVNVELPGSP